MGKANKATGRTRAAARGKAKRRGRSDTLPEYDFRGAVRGKYFRRAAGGADMKVCFLALIAPDAARYFPDSDAVNDALRACAAIVRAGSRRLE